MAKSSGFFSIPPEQLTALATIIGFLLANDFDADEQNSLANFILAIGQTIASISAQKAIFESKEDNQQMIQRLDTLKRYIGDIEEELRNDTKR